MPASRSSFQIDEALRKIAADRLGLIPTAVAAAYGVNSKALSRRRQTGELVPVFHGVHRLAAVPLTENQRFLAASLALPGAIVAGPSAAIIHGMPLPREFRAASADVIVAVRKENRSRIAGISAVRLQHTGSSWKWMTGLVSSPAATLVLLSRYLDLGHLERSLDHCIAVRLASTQGLMNEIDRWPPRGLGNTAQLRQMALDRSDGSPTFRSKVEQRVAKWLRQADLGGWRANHRVATGNGRAIEVDFAWPNRRVALEVSPFFTHGSRVKQARDAERRRQLTCAGWVCLEALDDQLDNERAFAPLVADLRGLLR